MLLGLCPSIVGYCLSVCYWVVYVFCSSIITRYPSLLDTVCPLVLSRYLSVCYWVCVHQLLVIVCSCVTGWFMSTVHPLLLGYPSLLDKYVQYCWVGICPYVIGFVSINCW